MPPPLPLASSRCLTCLPAAFIVALSVAFNQVAGTGSVTWLMVADLLGSCVYLIDLFMGFHSGIIVRWDSRAVVVRGAQGGPAYDRIQPNNVQYAIR